MSRVFSPEAPEAESLRTSYTSHNVPRIQSTLSTAREYKAISPLLSTFAGTYLTVVWRLSACKHGSYGQSHGLLTVSHIAGHRPHY